MDLSWEVRFVASVVLGCFLVFGGHSLLYAQSEADDGEASHGVSRGGLSLRGFEDPEMDFQLLRSLGADWAGGGTVGEILVAASAITDGDPLTWPQAFAELAERIEQDGRKRGERGFPVSARESLLRAASYWRAAEYYGDFRHPETLEQGMRSRQCFLDAVHLFDWMVEDVRLPYQDTFLPGYFLTPPGEGPFPVIAAISGYDGTAEEMFFGVGKGGLDRGWAVFLFEIPGQVGARRFNPDLVFLPDNGEPVGAAVDYLLTHPQVDPERLVLYGASMGGYLMLSAVLSENRPKALIANSPIIDLYQYLTAFGLSQLMDMPMDLTLEDIDQIPDEFITPGQKRGLVNLLLRYGQTSVSSFFTYLKQFTVTERLQDISVPVLALVGESEGAVPVEQAKYFKENSGGEVTLFIFDHLSGADSHCQLNNLPLSNAVTFDWLEDLFSSD